MNQFCVLARAFPAATDERKRGHFCRLPEVSFNRLSIFAFYTVFGGVRVKTVNLPGSTLQKFERIGLVTDLL